MKLQKSSILDVRRINRSAVLRCIYLGQSTSRTEISQYSGLSSATVTHIIVDLRQEGIVVESSLEASQGGRPRSIVTINPHYGYFIGVEIGETIVRVELFDLTLHKIGSIAFPQKPDENQPEQVVQYIDQGVKAVLSDRNVRLEQVIGMGVGVGGRVEEFEQVSAYHLDARWQNVPLAALLEERFSFPVYLDNCAKAMAQAESMFGVSRNYEHLAILLVGTGIGAGIITDNVLYRGSDNSAGEWGHTTIELDGRLCRCGSYGCLEAYAGAPGIITSLRELAPESPLLANLDQEERTISAIVAAARAGDAVAVQVLKDTARYLGAGIANLINLFNPQLVVLGGWVGLEIGPYIFPDLLQFAAHYALKRPFSVVKVELSHLSHDAVAMGAAAAALEQFLRAAGRLTASRRDRASRLVMS